MGGRPRVLRCCMATAVAQQPIFNMEGFGSPPHGTLSYHHGHVPLSSRSPVIVASMEIFEVNHPGAIVEIKGRKANRIAGEEDEPWLTL